MINGIRRKGEQVFKNKKEKWFNIFDGEKYNKYTYVLNIYDTFNAFLVWLLF